MSDGLYIGGSDWSLETVCVGVGVVVLLGVVVVGNGRYRSRYRNPSVGIGCDTGLGLVSVAWGFVVLVVLVILVILVILVVEEEERGTANRKNGMQPRFLKFQYNSFVFSPRMIRCGGGGGISYHGEYRCEFRCHPIVW